MQAAAKSIGVSKTALLALQSLGSSGGNCVGIQNIIFAKAVVGLPLEHVSEGAFVFRTAGALAMMLLIGTVMALPFLFA